MIIFRNPGLIELAAVTTMGLSVKSEGSFGRFGTGIKYGVATVLRGGGSVTIFRGTERHDFSIEKGTVRGTEFDFVCLDGIRIGFTTQLGRDWKPWMVLREFGCNALDEGGEFWATGIDRPFPDICGEETMVAIDWAELDTAYKQRGDLFLEGEALFENAAIRVLPGPSAHIFYRGIRVFKTEKPCVFTYDLLSDQDLTEDRTLASSWAADSLIRNTLTGMGDIELIRQAITSGPQYHEHGLNFGNEYVTPSTEFIKAATAAREGSDKEKLSPSASDVARRAQRQQQAEESHSGRIRIDRTPFTDAIQHLYELGMEFAEAQRFVEVTELSGEARTILEGGTVFMLRSLMLAGPREIATELIKRWVDLQPGVYSLDQGVALLTPRLLDAVPDLRRAREAEEKRVAALAEAEAAKAGIELPVELSAEEIEAAEAGPITTPLS